MVKNDFIKKYFTCLSKIFVCVAFAFLLVFSFGQNDLKKSFAYENDVSSYSGYINDLTGSQWEFNNEIDFSLLNDMFNINGNIDFNISFYFDFDDGDISPSLNPLRINRNYDIYKITGYIQFPVSAYDLFNNNYSPSWNNIVLNRTIYITGGLDVSNASLISFLYQNATLIYSPITPVNTYNITINLDNGIYGQTSATIEENSTLTLDYTVVNNGVFSGYVFDYGQNLITSDSGHGHISVSGNYEKITIIISDVTEDFEFTINSITGRSLVGVWYLDYDLYLASGLQSIDIDVVLSRPFVSNDVTYNRIYRTTNFNSFAYENTEYFELPIVNVFSFLNGLYLPVNTYNYLLVDIDYDENYVNYVPDDYMFFNFFRLATNEDIARVNQLNEQLVVQKENTNFVALFGAILDAQFGTLKSLLNFYIFDINVWSIVTFFLTMALIYIVVKLCKGGMSDDKKK